MLAQMAPTDPEACGLFERQLTNHLIPPAWWAHLSGPLAGERYYPVDGVLTSYPAVPSLADVRSTHVTVGNQNFYQMPGEDTLTPEGVGQRLGLVTQWLAAVTDPAGREALEQAQASLQTCQGHLASSPPAGVPPGGP